MGLSFYDQRISRKFKYLLLCTECNFSKDEIDTFVQREDVLKEVKGFLGRILMHSSSSNETDSNIPCDQNTQVPGQPAIDVPSELDVSDDAVIVNVDSTEEQKMEAIEAPSEITTIIEPTIDSKTSPLSHNLPSVSLHLLSSENLHPGTIPPAGNIQKEPLPSLDQKRTSFYISANGKENVPFNAKVEGRRQDGVAVAIHSVVIPADLGLEFNPETAELHGVPLKSGEFKFKLHYQFLPSTPDGPKLESEVALIVNPDPKSLWKNLPSDNVVEYQKADEDTLYIKGSDGFCMVAASKRGRSHAHVGSCRDDDFCLMEDEANGWRIIAVADGAGSAKKSRKGSMIASQVAAEHLLKSLSGECGQKLNEGVELLERDPLAAKSVQKELYYLFGHAAREAVNSIEEEAKATGSVYKDFSTTLLIAIHKKVLNGYLLAAYWVGDGGIGVYRQGHEVKILGKPDSGEFAGQTRFLDSAMLDAQEIMNRIKVTIVPDFTAIIAMTDGITDPWFETDANFERLEKWEELWAELQPITSSSDPATELLDWLDFWSAGNHDDRTIAILYPQKSGTRTEVTI